jgi:hypothetical protein
MGRSEEAGNAGYAGWGKRLRRSVLGAAHEVSGFPRIGIQSRARQEAGYHALELRIPLADARGSKQSKCTAYCVRGS